MRTESTAAFALALVVAVLAAGCEQPSGHPPYTVGEYEDMQKASPYQYAPATVLLISRQRMLDRDLTAQERVASMALVEKLGGGDTEIAREMAAIAADATAPPALRDAAARSILSREDPALIQPAVYALLRLPPGDPLAGKIAGWLSQHGVVGVVETICKAWVAVGKSADAQAQAAIKTLSGSPWDAALVQCLDSEVFGAKGEAIELLSSRVPAASLARQILDVTPMTEPMQALQAFLTSFDYVPATVRQYAIVIDLYTASSAKLPVSAMVYQQFHRDGYRFDLRDMHLLESLGADPKRTLVPRSELEARLTDAMAAQEHPAIGSLKDRKISDKLADNLAALTQADLWNLLLIHEMLGRPKVQAGLAKRALQVREDPAIPSGGLVRYSGGQANAMLYLGDERADADGRYVFSERAIVESRQSLCRFRLRFVKVDSSAQAGPDREDLAEADRANCSGLVLTSINSGAFCAHYYTPSGRVVSLGVYPFQTIRLATTTATTTTTTTAASQP